MHHEERGFRSAFAALDQGRRQALRAGLCGDGLSLLGDGRKLDDVGGRKAEAETCLDFRRESCRREGIATEIEKFVMGADGINAEDVLPDGRELCFGIGLRRAPRAR